MKENSGCNDSIFEKYSVLQDTTDVTSEDKDGKDVDVLQRPAHAHLTPMNKLMKIFGHYLNMLS